MNQTRPPYNHKTVKAASDNPAATGSQPTQAKPTPRPVSQGLCSIEICCNTHRSPGKVGKIAARTNTAATTCGPATPAQAVQLSATRRRAAFRPIMAPNYNVQAAGPGTIGAGASVFRLSATTAGFTGHVGGFILQPP